MSPFEHKGRAFRAEIRAKADPKRAWEAWTDPEKIAQWFVDRAKGEVKAGSVYTWFFDAFRFEVPYQVVQADPGRSFVLKGEIPGRPPGFLEIVIGPAEGGTVIRLINSGFQEGASFDEEYEGVASGWTQALAMLALYLERHFGRPKETRLILRTGPGLDYAKLRPYYATADGLRAWLAAAASLDLAAGRYAIDLRGGGRASGRVLSDTGREVGLEWDEADGLLELKAFAMGPAARAVCLRATSWRPGALGAYEPALQGAVDRLAAAMFNTQPH